MSADFDWLMTSRDELILDCSTVLQLILYHNKQHWPYSYSQLQKNMTKMPKRCVVGRCGAVNNDGISLHKCPKEEMPVRACLCVRACACVPVRACLCVRACACVPMRACLCVRACACVHMLQCSAR